MNYENTFDDDFLFLGLDANNFANWAEGASVFLLSIF